jgi:mevalonate kinase
MIELSVPSKTFLLGEYGVLQNGGGLLVNTSPRFVIKAEKAVGQCAHSGIPVNSPAHKFLLANKETMNKLNIEFLDPHFGKGGFGASSAQFVLLYALSEIVRGGQLAMGKSTFSDIHSTYSEYSKIEGNAQPSGIDVISQLLGELAWVQPNEGHFHQCKWWFADIGFVVIRTGNKLATHKHLTEIKDLDFSKLKSIAQSGYQAVVDQNAAKFVEAIVDAATALEEAELVLPRTKDLLQEIEGLDSVLAAKGCGAMGADTILAIVKRGSGLDVRNWCESAGCDIVSSHIQLCEGFRMTSSTKQGAVDAGKS